MHYYGVPRKVIKKAYEFEKKLREAKRKYEKRTGMKTDLFSDEVTTQTYETVETEWEGQMLMRSRTRPLNAEVLRDIAKPITEVPW